MSVQYITTESHLMLLVIEKKNKIKNKQTKNNQMPHNTGLLISFLLLLTCIISVHPSNPFFRGEVVSFFSWRPQQAYCACVDLQFVISQHAELESPSPLLLTLDSHSLISLEILKNTVRVTIMCAESLRILALWERERNYHLVLQCWILCHL